MAGVPSPYSDLDRPPLRPAALRRALVVPGGLWTDLQVVAETTSTNEDVARAARAGAAEGLVITAESQSSGRGRLGRQWTMPARAGIAVSVLLRPQPVPAARYGWLPLLAGVALVEAVRRIAAVDAVLKWPNDLLIDDRKAGGVLVEMHGSAAVVGIGLNTTVRADELPVPAATSLALAAAESADRDPLLRAVLRRLEFWYGRWRAAGGDVDAAGLRETYVVHCATIGRNVRVDLPGGATATGRAEAVDPDGRIVVDGRAYAAGDIVHLR
jgi:BirA family transcriptional regulator, biotin operon repressor / biotin---[acetyl-CoA-carboxylase] ligase